MSRRMALIAILFAVALPASAAEKIVLVAGSDASGSLDGPFGVDFDRDGNTYIVEMPGQRLFRIDDKGALTHIAGTGKKGDGGDGGPATRAEFNGPHSLAVGPDGAVYVADTWNNRVRRIEPKT